MQKGYGPLSKNGQNPGWLANVLAITREAESEEMDNAFLGRAMQTAKQAWAVKKLQYEQRKYGFVPLPLPVYLAELARIAGVSAEITQELLPDENQSEIGVAWTNAASLLLQRLGVGMEEALTYLRITFGVYAGFDPVPALVMRRRAAHDNGNDLIRYETILNAHESNYDPETRRRLRQLERAMQDVYKETVDGTQHG